MDKISTSSRTQIRLGFTVLLSCRRSTRLDPDGELLVRKKTWGEHLVKGL